MTDTTVAEGQVKFRDGKKWKTRWVVLRKPSPVADCLSLLVYKDKKKEREKSRYHKERLNVTIEAICGVEPGPGYDGVAYSLSILCLSYSVALGFHSREALAAWDTRIRYSLGEVHRFNVQVQPGTKLESGPASLHLCNNLLVLTRETPPVLIGQWKLSELRRYGAVPDGFVFEGGTRCGYRTGVYFLSCSEGEQISFLLDCIVRGISPSRAPRGLRPALPEDPSANTSSSEERINVEALELEKRLSMLSHCSRPSSTASTYSCSTVAGDDRSSMSSSSSSQSDASFGSRHLAWAEPTSTRSRLSNEMVSSSSTFKGLTSSDDLLYNAMTVGSTIGLSSNQSVSHGLHDSGRQNSLDSGIGIASSSQSSGSFSSYTSSLDAASQAGGEEFGSLASLPVASSCPPSPFRASLPPSVLPPSPTSPLSMVVGQRGSASSAPASHPSTSDSDAFLRLTEEYQAPGLLGLHYDTPRSLLHDIPRTLRHDTPKSLLHSLSPRDPQAQGGPLVMGKDRRSGGAGGEELGPSGSPAELSIQPAGPQHHATSRSHSWGSETAPSVDSAGRCTSKQLLCAGCHICGGSQCIHPSDNYIIPERWRSARGGNVMQVANYEMPHLFLSSGAPCTSDDPSTDSKDRLHGAAAADGVNKGFIAPERPGPYLAPSVPDGTPKEPPCLYKPVSASGMSVLPPHKPLPSTSLDQRLFSANTVNYMNVPVSPAAAKTRELLHTEQQLKAPSTRYMPF